MIIFWKIYFWVLTFLIVVGSITEGSITYWDIIEVPALICALAGLFSYAYRKRIFNKTFWKAFLPVYIIWDLIYNLAIYPKYSEEPTKIIYLLLGFIFIVPLYMALYRYAFKFLEGKEEFIEKDSAEIDPLDNVPYPTIPRRYLSTVIDSILIVSLFFIISFIFQQDSGYIKNIRLALVVSIVFLYEPLFTSKLCTLGQKLTGIRVRDAGSRQRISLLAAFGRTFIKLILGIISFFSIPFTKKRRGIHDFAASSIVIYDYQDKD